MTDQPAPSEAGELLAVIERVQSGLLNAPHLMQAFRRSDIETLVAIAALPSFAEGVEASARGRKLWAKATRIRVGWKLRTGSDGGDRYELIGDPCGFPVATFGDASDVEFYEWAYRTMAADSRALAPSPATAGREEMERLKAERDAYRTQAINRGWSWGMCNALGREEYERWLAEEVDETNKSMLAKIGAPLPQGQPL